MKRKKELGTTALALIIILILSILLFMGLLFSGTLKINDIRMAIKFSSIPSVIINDITAMQDSINYKKELTCKNFQKLLSNDSYICKKTKDKVEIINDNLIFYSFDSSMSLNTSLSRKLHSKEYDLSIYYKNAKEYDNSYNHEINQKLKEELKNKFSSITNKNIRISQFDAYLTIYNFSYLIRN